MKNTGKSAIEMNRFLSIKSASILKSTGKSVCVFMAMEGKSEVGQSERKHRPQIVFTHQKCPAHKHFFMAEIWLNNARVCNNVKSLCHLILATVMALYFRQNYIGTFKRQHIHWVCSDNGSQQFHVP